jgi:hypothetical protein
MAGLMVWTAGDLRDGASSCFFCVSLKNPQTFASSHHPYEMPELISTPVKDGSKEYLKWMENP